MEKIIVSFPGQGAQYPGMAMDFYKQSAMVRDLFGQASDACGLDLKKLLESGNAEKLKDTQVAQAAIALADLASLAILEEKGCIPAAAAGFSLGEYVACYAAGVFDIPTLFQLVGLRGRLMRAACESAVTSYGKLMMAAVIGINRETVDRILEENKADGLFLANDNSTRQVVLSGRESELERLLPVFKKAGARRIVPLSVSGPFHSPYMAQAGREFAKRIGSIPFNDPIIPIFSNVTGVPMLTGQEVKELAGLQITSTVAWRKTMESIIASFDKDVLYVEAGPGKVLTGFWKTMDVSCCPCGTMEAIEKTMEKKDNV
ncbi:MAG: ACP S-malonyltransferase [Spirochaetia bacterium]|jgi:[acyl-carrier-protein] S-malonyltransferase|nr:ACP S-malonyltransferase [Spirochaetia bacterium]